MVDIDPISQRLIPVYRLVQQPLGKLVAIAQAPTAQTPPAFLSLPSTLSAPQATHGATALPLLTPILMPAGNQGRAIAPRQFADHLAKRRRFDVRRSDYLSTYPHRFFHGIRFVDRTLFHHFSPYFC